MNTKLKLAVASAVGTVGLMATSVFAAVDTDIASTTGAMTSTIKENLMGVLTTNLPTIVIVGVAVLSIFFIWKLFRRFIGR